MTSAEGDSRSADRAQYVVCVVLAAVGGFLIYDALSLGEGFAKVDPIGPRFFPIAVGVGLLVTATILAIAIPRGSKGEAEMGEDIDPNAPSDWRTVALLVALFVVVIVLVNPLGWVVVGTLLFAGATTVLGSRRYILNVVIGAALATLTFYGFYSGLGIPLPPGILDGIL